MREMLEFLDFQLTGIASQVRVSPSEIIRAVYRAGRGEQLTPAENEFFAADGRVSEATRLLVRSWLGNPKVDTRVDAAELLGLIARHDEAVASGKTKAPNVGNRAAILADESDQPTL